MRNAAAIAFLLVPLLCLPLAAASQPALEGQFEGAEDIPPQEWRRMAAGKTLVYKIGGEFWALETYRPGTNQVTLQLRDGSCMNSTGNTRHRFTVFIGMFRAPPAFAMPAGAMTFSSSRPCPAQTHRWFNT